MDAHVIRSATAKSFSSGNVELTPLVESGEAFSASLVKWTAPGPTVRNTKSDTAYFVISGSGSFILDGTNHDVEPGDLIVVPRGTPHQDGGGTHLLSFHTPPFDPDAVEEVAPS
jgi:mannose-6-phosphate isomerase-like protein (cupin superfamily)